MSCVVEFEDRRFNFMKNVNKQKFLIQTLLVSGLLDLTQISIVLNVSIEAIQHVHEGTMCFYNETAEKLGKLFLLAFSE